MAVLLVRSHGVLGLRGRFNDSTARPCGGIAIGDWPCGVDVRPGKTALIDLFGEAVDDLASPQVPNGRNAIYQKHERVRPVLKLVIF